ncbi:hypothetical protein AMTR_s00022p00220640 [Amborella trichopoda]|uniref:Uncharacterized protein n=1 Tax=Amborella trichopoda TaxID=13333 RepID=W1PVG5_AMBTC|nr:hypothetical protein AMTR_s00022p00220640 [Amborella trichopoda]
MNRAPEFFVRIVGSPLLERNIFRRCAAEAPSYTAEGVPPHVYILPKAAECSYTAEGVLPNVHMLLQVYRRSTFICCQSTKHTAGSPYYTARALWLQSSYCRSVLWDCQSASSPKTVLLECIG